MTIPLKQVIQAIEEASEVFTSFWDAKTGKTVYLADPLMTDMTEEDKALAAEMEKRRSGFFVFRPSMRFINTASWRISLISSLPEGRRRNLPMPSEEKAHSADSNSLCAITGWNSVGMIIWRRRIESLRSAGAQRKAWSTQNERE